MGIDYDAYFGIGIEIKEINFEETSLDEPFNDCKYMDDYLEIICKWGVDLEYIMTGNFMSGRNIQSFVILKEPLKNGVDKLEQRMNDLVNLLNTLKIPNDGINVG